MECEKIIWKPISVRFDGEVPKKGAYLVTYYLDLNSKSDAVGYWLDGKLHREDGPAIIEETGECRYYIHNNQYPEKEYWKRLHFMGKITQKELLLRCL